jgi:Flp pilus assembly protein TadD
MACTETATKLNNQALLDLKVKNYDEAITLLKKAAAIEPDNVQTHFMLGMAYKVKGELAEAISEYKKALDVNPNNIFIQCLLADAYLATGRIDDAITVSKKTIVLDPESALGHYNLGIAYKKQNKKTAAAHHLYKAGLLAFVDSGPKLAIKSYRALEETGHRQTTQELYELLKPLLTPDSKTVSSSSS